MKKIKNPYCNMEGYNCFGCAPHNNHGLHLEFFLDGDNTIVAYWNPETYYQGYFNVLHGGIQAALLDEAAGWVVSIILRTAGVTSRMEVRYRKPVMVTDKTLTIKAKLLENEKRLAAIKAELVNEKGELCAEANVQYFIFPQQTAMEKYHYPGIDAFF
ncbi:MAG: PaaI family thioesterase [Tannerella sp.]|jgi:uncharacterized protein (TIGR00369 family)|nr:PaaI family thioesterase [Tannerella sp.]